MELLIREEQTEDMNDIHLLTQSAFSTVSYSSNTEHLIVDELRNLGGLALSLVALIDGKVIGHVAFSPVTVTDESKGWFALGPISVSPAFQKQGIGARLINSGLDKLKIKGANGCVLVGDPQYYSKFGFKTEPGFVYPELPPEYFQVLAFDSKIPHGKVVFHSAFSVTG